MPEVDSHTDSEWFARLDDMTKDDRGVRTCKYCEYKLYAITRWESDYPRLLFNLLQKHVAEKHPLELECLKEKWKEPKKEHPVSKMGKMRRESPRVWGVMLEIIGDKPAAEQSRIWKELNKPSS